MIQHDLAKLFRYLEAYWPHGWTDERLLVFGEVLAEIGDAHGLDAAVAAVRSMGRAERYPTVAALLDHARRTRGFTGHIPGTGFLTYTAGQRELATPQERDAAIIGIAEARARLRPLELVEGTG